MNILLLSGYDAVSHRCWREGLVAAFPDWSFTVLSMPPRYFSWRIRGNALHFADQLKDNALNFDVIIATSMVDLSTLKGLVPALSSIPVLLYFHENQFEFPKTAFSHQSIEPMLVTIYSALAADKVCFNSKFNRDSFLRGAQGLLKRFPDFVPAGLIDQVEIKSSVLPVPLLDDVYLGSNIRATRQANSVVWNHRWEYDKGPDRLLDILRAIPSKRSFVFHIVGQRFKNEPKEMADIRVLLEQNGWLGHWGPIASRTEYLSLLASTECVLSTAIHDFQGLSVLEAVAKGCMPVVPDRLAYQEYIPKAYRYYSSDADIGKSQGGTCSSNKNRAVEASEAAKLIMHTFDELNVNHTPALKIGIEQLKWTCLRPAYKTLIAEL